MGGDYSRVRFDVKRDFSHVLQQQGRVHLDAEWNELVDLIDRRWRAETMDIIGEATVPKETADGFKIDVDANGQLTIGRGRIYVDGLLAENHGAQGVAFDPHLAEATGTEALKYVAQPYFASDQIPDPVPGKYLVYLDIWPHEVTILEQPNLMEQAVGVDTTTRVQTAWQVKLHKLDDGGHPVTCETPDEQIPDWKDIIHPSDARLTTGVLDEPAVDDPCILPPGGGYRGTENRLYRIEIHSDDPSNEPTFKWSRDNASVGAAVHAINGSTLTVSLTKRNILKELEPGDWIEITDDEREFQGKSGELLKVVNVEDATRTITVSSPPTIAWNLKWHTRMRRWDQKGLVRDTTGTLVADMDATGGSIPISGGKKILLEDQVYIEFSVLPDNAVKSGDYWVFAARTADAAGTPSVETLDNAPPRGVHHHFARLALVTIPATGSLTSDDITDCRYLWPQDPSCGCCDGTVCVTESSHRDGTLTIQRAIDKVKDTGGTVCLGPGLYQIDSKKRSCHLVGAKSVHLEGQGWKTALIPMDAQPAIVVSGSAGVTISDLSILLPRAGLGIALHNSAAVTTERCIIGSVPAPKADRVAASPGVSGGRDTRTLGIGLSGFLLHTALRNNVLMTDVGIRSITTPIRNSGDASSFLLGLKPYGYLFTLSLAVDDNVLLCRESGIVLDGVCLHFGNTRLSGNTVYLFTDVGISLLGYVPFWHKPKTKALVFGPGAAPIASGSTGRSPVTMGSRLDVANNVINGLGDGIVVGTDSTRITDNDVSGSSRGTTVRDKHGVVLAAGLDPTGIDLCQVIGNRVVGTSGHGVALKTFVRSGMIKQNIIEEAGTGGIVMEAGSSAGVLTIENNQLLSLSPNDPGKDVTAIGLVSVESAEVASNTIKGVLSGARSAWSSAGIRAMGCRSIRIAGNDITDIGPVQGGNVNTAGIDVIGSFDRLDVFDNSVRRHEQRSSDSESNWAALRVGSLRKPGTTFLGVRFIPDLIRTSMTRGGASVARMRGEAAEVGAAGTASRPAEVPPLNSGWVLADLSGIVTKIQQGREGISVRGNLMQSDGSAPLVDINVPSADTCLFSENRCFLEASVARPGMAGGGVIRVTSFIGDGGRTAGITASVVKIGVRSAVVSSNYIEGPKSIHALQATVLKDGNTLRATVLGNLSNGGIMLNGAGVESMPWAALNVVTP